MGKIYAIERKTGKFLHEFNTISELLNYYVDRLIDLYDEKGNIYIFNYFYEF